MSDFTVDLAKVDGDGAFRCPKCGNPISPDDETEQNYVILDRNVVSDSLEFLRIKCQKCASVIRLEGFQTLRQFMEVKP